MVDKDIQQLNRLYLMIAQRLATTDPELASQITGLSRVTLGQVAKLSMSDIDEIHQRMNLIMFRPRMPDASFVKLLEMPGSTMPAFMSAMMVGSINSGEPYGNEG